MKNKIKNLCTAVSSVAMMAAVTLNAAAVTNNVAGGLESAANEVKSSVKSITNSVIIPIVAIILLVVLIFQISGAVIKHRQGEEYKEKILPIVGLVCGLIVITTFPAWGWTMIGM